MGLKVYLDDVRNTPQGFDTRVYCRVPCRIVDDILEKHEGIDLKETMRNMNCIIFPSFKSALKKQIALENLQNV